MPSRDLERTLGSIPPHPAPRVDLEQYATPSSLAAPLLMEALGLGDIRGKRVTDLGCGTGVFAIGASLLGAASAVGIDVDGASLEVARAAAKRLGAEVEWVEGEVSRWQGSADTVMMNPPFGAQQRGADRAFLDAAFRTAPVVYTLHNAVTRAFVEAYAQERGFATSQAWRLMFPLRQQYRHQERAVQEIEVTALRLTLSIEKRTSDI